jgi:hypothetical protein
MGGTVVEVAVVAAGAVVDVVVVNATMVVEVVVVGAGGAVVDEGAGGAVVDEGAGANAVLVGVAELTSSWDERYPNAAISATTATTASAKRTRPARRGRLDGNRIGITPHLDRSGWPGVRGCRPCSHGHVRAER